MRAERESTLRIEPPRTVSAAAWARTSALQVGASAVGGLCITFGVARLGVWCPRCTHGVAGGLLGVGLLILGLVVLWGTATAIAREPRPMRAAPAAGPYRAVAGPLFGFPFRRSWLRRISETAVGRWLARPAFRVDARGLLVECRWARRYFPRALLNDVDWSSGGVTLELVSRRTVPLATVPSPGWGSTFANLAEADSRLRFARAIYNRRLAQLIRSERPVRRAPRPAADRRRVFPDAA